VTPRRTWIYRLIVVLVAWAMPRIAHGELREAFDQAFRRRDQDWRDALWREAADRVAARA
jgi:hypothetical protein